MAQSKVTLSRAQPPNAVTHMTALGTEQQCRRSGRCSTLERAILSPSGELCENQRIYCGETYRRMCEPTSTIYFYPMTTMVTVDCPRSGHKSGQSINAPDCDDRVAPKYSKSAVYRTSLLRLELNANLDDAACVIAGSSASMLAARIVRSLACSKSSKCDRSSSSVMLHGRWRAPPRRSDAGAAVR